MKYLLISCVLIGMLLASGKLRAQTLPVGQLDLDALLRTKQLTGNVDPSISFAVRPLQFGKNNAAKTGLLDRATVLTLLDSTKEMQYRSQSFGNGKGELVWLPALFKLKFNSHHPYGWNDEGMIAAKGLQTQLSAGVYAKYGPVSVQLQPQLLMAANPGFAYNAAYGDNTSGSMTKLLPGQSSIKIHAGALALGLSTENLWWGPGQFSSLLLSNNAPGFTHVGLQTTRPIKTPIGAFEFQLLGGRLNEDSAAGGLYENRNLKSDQLKNNWRYLNAMVVSYQPAFLPGVFFGATRAFQLYGNDFKLQTGSITNKYVPVLSALFKNAAGGAAEDARARDQQISLFTRWLFPKSHAEFYVEYGWNDHKANSRDFVIDPQHAAAYIIGGKKLVPTRSPGVWIEINGEITQMAQSTDYLVRNAGNWYEHGLVLQGMTNQRQILGAGSGFGNNVQTIAVSWLRGIQKLGIQIQRVQHDPGALGGSFGNLGLRDDAWNELAIGFLARWRFGKIIASADLQFTRSGNYAWEKNKNVGNVYGLVNIGYWW